MTDSTMVYQAIRHMSRKQLKRVCAQWNFHADEKPRILTPTLRDIVRSAYRDGTISGADVMEESQKYGA